jgi:hypothetical protein
MARAGIPMQITPVDQDNNLFEIINLVPQSLVEKITQTPWLSLLYHMEPSNRDLRRRVANNQLSWIAEWHECIDQAWSNIVQATGCDHLEYFNLDGSATGFWIDMPSYTCPMHTDGELPGAIQMYWIAPNQDLGTTWYHYKDTTSIRHNFEFKPNTGYIMINQQNPNGYRKLQWHGMLTPVPKDSFRVSSYSWLANK